MCLRIQKTCPGCQALTTEEDHFLCSTPGSPGCMVVSIEVTLERELLREWYCQLGEPDCPLNVGQEDMIKGEVYEVLRRMDYRNPRWRNGNYSGRSLDSRNSTAYFQNLSCR